MILCSCKQNPIDDSNEMGDDANQTPIEETPNDSKEEDNSKEDNDDKVYNDNIDWGPLS